jgi:hypothetical protein
MNNKILITTFLFLSIFGCESVNTIDINDYEKNNLNTLEEYRFQQGAYYTYEFSSLYETIDPAEEINRLISKNIIVNHVWYRVHRNGCPVGSGGNTNTMYKSVFLVCMYSDNQRILNENYNHLSSSSKIPCAHNVQHYELK